MELLSKTSPIAALHVEMGEIPLQPRRKQLMMTYWADLQAHSVNRNPTKTFLFQIGNMEKVK